MTSVFAYVVNDEMLCPKCGKGKEGAQECHRKAYSFGYEVIGCYQCGETLKTPF